MPATPPLVLVALPACAASRRAVPQLRHKSMPEGAGGTCAQGPRAGPGLPSAVGTAWGMPQASAPVPACPDGATPRPPQRPGHPQQTPAAPRMSRASRHRCHMPFPIPHAGSHPMGAVVARSREGAHARARAPSSPRPTHSYRNLRIRNRRTKRSTPVNFRVQSGGNPHARGGGVWVGTRSIKTHTLAAPPSHLSGARCGLPCPVPACCCRGRGFP